MNFERNDIYMTATYKYSKNFNNYGGYTQYDITDEYDDFNYYTSSFIRDPQTIFENGKRLYLAYGSNLSIQQMCQRLGGEFEPVGYGYIKGYKLSFRKSSSGYYCSIDKSKNKNDKVPVGAFLISDLSLIHI